MTDEKKSLRAEILEVIPDNWLHPLLTGPRAIIGVRDHQITPKQVERLLRELRFDLSRVLDKHGIKGNAP